MRVPHILPRNYMHFMKGIVLMVALNPEYNMYFAHAFRPAS
jgi:hypothetical protein